VFVNLRRLAMRLTVAYVVAALGTSAVPPPVSAVAFGQPGPILFAQWSPDYQGYYLHTLAPGAEAVVVPNTAGAAGGRWSPDGRVITYSIWNEGIYIINPDGSGKRLLFPVGQGESVGQGVWSPDGTKLAFTINAPDAPLNRVEIADSLTGERHRPDTGLAEVWDWSPAGFLLGSAWRPGGASPNENGEIAKFTFADRQMTFLTHTLNHSEGAPRLSPDGSKIVFLSYSSETVGYQSIGIINADGSNRRLIRETGGQVTWPAWRPDGQAIVFGPHVTAMTVDGKTAWSLGVGWGEDGFDWAPLAGTTTSFAIQGVRALALPDPSVQASASASASTIKPASLSLSGEVVTATSTSRSVTIRQEVREPAIVRLRIFRPSGTVLQTIKFGLKTGPVSYTWNGRLPDGRLAPAGTYKFVARAVDLAGNVKKKVFYVKVVR
jgi:hypothetical protein